MSNEKKQVDNAAENRSETPNKTTIEAIEEGRRIAGDPNVKGFSSMEELVAEFSGDPFYEEHELIEVAAVYAMQAFQTEMTGEAEKAGLSTEDDVIKLVKELRTDGLD